MDITRTRMVDKKELGRKNYGMFNCPSCGELNSYMFKSSTVWKEAQKEFKDKLKAVLDGGGTSESFIEDLEEILTEED